MISWRFMRDFGALAIDRIKPQNMRFSVDQAGSVCGFLLGIYGIREVAWIFGLRKGGV
jgi:hypothetical protein